MGGLIVIDVYETPSFSSDNGAKYAIFKFIGIVPVTNKCVLLIAETNPDTMEKFRGIIGSIYELRGSNEYSLNVHKYDVIAIKSYTNFKGETTGINSKIGLCTYEGSTYICINLIGSMNRLIYFSGLYSETCLFKILEESKITWID